MPKTKISDVIVPEVFAPYVIKRTMELSEIVRSGIAIGSQELNGLITGGGATINMPFWKPIGGDDEVLSDTTPLNVDKITTGADIAALLIRGKAWSANELAGALAGSSPMTAIATQVAQWWSIREQRVLLSILNGIFASALATSHTNDQSSAVLSAELVLDTKQLLGDAAGKLTTLFMHSVVYTTLQKQNLIEYIPDAEGKISFASYLGYRLIVDDMLVGTNGVYPIYLSAPGTFGRGDGIPVDLTPVETDRDSLQSDDILINRRALVIHPLGVKWKGNPAGATPSNAELATGANWEKVYEDKAIGLALLKCRIAPAPEPPSGE
jgi:hypothetical protein